MNDPAPFINTELVFWVDTQCSCWTVAKIFRASHRLLFKKAEIQDRRRKML